MSRPDRSYLVCATPRSGSTLLCHLLDDTGIAGHPEEYFEALQHSGVPRRPHEYFDRERHANIVHRLAFREMPDRAPTPSPLWSPETYDRYLAWALQEGTTPNGVFGAKLMWGYLPDFAALLRNIEGMQGLPIPALLDRSFPDLRYVRITRLDKVRQAISLWKAVQTQDWKQREAGAPTPPKPEYSFRAINFLVRQLTAHDSSWDAYFDGLGIDPVKVTYEDLAEDREAVIRRVLQCIDLELPDGFTLGTPPLSVQADDLSEEWRERYMRHLEADEPVAPPPTRPREPASSGAV